MTLSIRRTIHTTIVLVIAAFLIAAPVSQVSAGEFGSSGCTCTGG